MAGTTRSRILDATNAVLIDGGQEAVKMASMAKRAGLTSGVIYGHSDSKSDVIFAAILHI